MDVYIPRLAGRVPALFLSSIELTRVQSTASPLTSRSKIAMTCSTSDFICCRTADCFSLPSFETRRKSSISERELVSFSSTSGGCPQKVNFLWSIRDTGDRPGRHVSLSRGVLDVKVFSVSAAHLRQVIGTGLIPIQPNWYFLDILSPAVIMTKWSLFKGSIKLCFRSR